MTRDYKPDAPHDRQPFRKSLPNCVRWLGLAATLFLLVSIFFLMPDNAKATRTDTLTTSELSAAVQAASKTIKPGQRVTLPLAIPGGHKTLAEPEVEAQEPALPWSTITVKSGDNLALIFARQKLSPQQLDHLMRADKALALLKRLMPGQQLRFQLSDAEGQNKQLQQLEYRIDALNTLRITRQADGRFVVKKETRELEPRVTNASGLIESSLFLAGQAAGLSDNLIMELAGIFGWDVDFALDIRSGDRFTVVYEELFLDGEKQRDGNIIAAEFTNRGKTFRALRYTDAKGRADYYSPDGRSMRKAFLRTPVDFTRISSRFGKRYHPTLKKRKNHHGVDYAAPRGTPIKASGDGKLLFVGRKGGYGKTVIIQHGGKYSTLYAHMSRIKPGMRRGKRVRQGQTIGYVGSTGRSTGPHLHYEFRVNGVHRNPLTVRLPDAAPIRAEYKPDFLNKSRKLVALLDVLQRSTVALNDKGK
ncbi:MAG: peptidoglycan DD-metalloendopeptidase family protein [Gammaproteobacteria bacterium]|nr:peptidoglycan DD-metalloendopeptidase family protein [Gammaproteobacteria bacterium]